MKKNAGLVFVSVLSLAHGAFAADSRPRRDFSAQLSQVGDALIGQSSVRESGSHFYEGRDGQGRSCLVTVQYGAKSIDVEIKLEGKFADHESSIDVSVPASSKDITSLETNSNSRSLGVEIQQEITPYGSTAVDHYAYQLHAELDDAAAGLGRMTSVVLMRDENGKREGRSCGKLRPVLALTQADVDSLGDQARGEYLRRNPGDQVGASMGADVQSCSINDAQSVTCDVGLATDYTPDTLHVTLGIKSGSLGPIQGIELEPGC